MPLDPMWIELKKKAAANIERPKIIRKNDSIRVAITPQRKQNMRNFPIETGKNMNLRMLSRNFSTSLRFGAE
jgi:hypothetical protein